MHVIRCVGRREEGESKEINGGRMKRRCKQYQVRKMHSRQHVAIVLRRIRSYKSMKIKERKQFEKQQMKQQIVQMGCLN